MDMRTFASQWMDAFNRRDWEEYASFFAEDVTYLTPGRVEPLVGRDAHVEQDRRNAGDSRLVADLIVPGDDGRHIVIEGRFEGSVRVSKWVTILEIRNEQIAAERLYFDRFRASPDSSA